MKRIDATWLANSGFSADTSMEVAPVGLVEDLSDACGEAMTMYQHGQQATLRLNGRDVGVWNGEYFVAH